MSVFRNLVIVIVVAVGLSAPVRGAGCYDISRGEPSTLTGTLDYVVFPGPPNYEDVQTGDTPEPNFVLWLAKPICVQGDYGANPGQMFQAIQIWEAPEMEGRLKFFLHRQVTVTLNDRFSAHTGHHHEPLVAIASAATLATARPMEYTDEYGTAATTIRAFYAALRDGQGDAASQMVVPEKRAYGPFSAAALSRFYGNLRRPLQLVDISQNGPNLFMAHYRFASESQVCDGRALISTVMRGGRNFIQAIRALDGC